MRTKLIKNTDCEYASARVQTDVKQRLRAIAAMRGVSLADVAGEMLSVGLDGYLSGGTLDRKAKGAIETIAAMKAISKGKEVPKE